MEYFKQGSEIKKNFWLKTPEGNTVPISELVAVLYEYKSGKIIARFDENENTPTITQNVALYIITPEITRKCPVDTEVWFAIAVKDYGKIYHGKIGKAEPSPLSEEL